MRVLTLVTPPANDPVLLDDAKLHLNIETNDDDTLITGMISDAVLHCESITNRRFVDQEWDYFIDHFHDSIEIPYAPLISVTSINYIDDNGAIQLLPASVYSVDSNSNPGFVRLDFGETWPATRIVHNAVIIRFRCGYTVLPGQLNRAILSLVESMYNDRDGFSTNRVDELLSNNKVF